MKSGTDIYSTYPYEPSVNDTYYLFYSFCIFSIFIIKDDSPVPAYECETSVICKSDRNELEYIFSTTMSLGYSVLLYSDSCVHVFLYNDYV